MKFKLNTAKLSKNHRRWRILTYKNIHKSIKMAIQSVFDEPLKWSLFIKLSFLYAQSMPITKIRKKIEENII